MTAAWHEIARPRIEAIHPASLLWIAPAEFDAFRQELAATPGLRLESLDPEAAPRRLPRLPRFDLAVGASVLETLEKEVASMLLARLRDVHAQRVLLFVERATLAGRWSADELVALGFHRFGEHGDVALYEFDIAQYKLTPDWLNAEHWAHPELFDKFRW